MQLKDLLVIGIIFFLIVTITRKSKKFRALSNPLIRRKCDTGGCGHFGAHRSAHPDRPHQGLDFLVQPGAPIFAAIDGRVRIAFPYASDLRFSGVEIIGSIYKVKVFYITPTVAKDQQVKAGDLIGYAQNLGVKYSANVPNHVHAEVRRYGVVVNPDTYFPKESVLIA